MMKKCQLFFVTDPDPGVEDHADVEAGYDSELQHFSSALPFFYWDIRQKIRLNDL
jgi:hypothetical protein